MPEKYDDFTMTEPQQPPVTQYSRAFETCWSQHEVGTKKTAWNAGKKAGWTDANWLWLAAYLERRHKEDVKWREGKYVPHLSTLINQERWTDVYKKVGPSRGSAQSVDESHEEALAKIERKQREWREMAEKRK